MLASFGSPLRAEPLSYKTPIAIADFTFTDTSGEPKDQTAAHAERLHRFTEKLARDLEQFGTYQTIPLNCPNEPCPQTPSEKAEAARATGARLLLIGGVQKMSTLVLWIKADVFDLTTDKPVLSRLLTFRGDNDAAWDHAEDFVLKQLRDLPAEPKP
jgi:hypothetical protein